MMIRCLSFIELFFNIFDASKAARLSKLNTNLIEPIIMEKMFFVKEPFINEIRPEEIVINKNSPNLYEESIQAHVLHGVHLLQRSEPLLKKLFEQKRLKGVGAIYDMHTGKVNLVSE